MQRLDFFIVGVQKGGTSALDASLRHHPAVQMAGRKELHYFDDERIDWRSPDVTALHRSFDWSVRDVVRGEATPIYTYWPRAIERIARYNPRAKLIVCLRHPVLRAYSHWRMERPAARRRCLSPARSEKAARGSVVNREASTGSFRTWSGASTRHRHVARMPMPPFTT